MFRILFKANLNYTWRFIKLWYELDHKFHYLFIQSLKNHLHEIKMSHSHIHTHTNAIVKKGGISINLWTFENFLSTMRSFRIIRNKYKISHVQHTHMCVCVCIYIMCVHFWGCVPFRQNSPELYKRE